jgi:hypothetical protein
LEEITLEDTKLLLFKVVEQAIRDYCTVNALPGTRQYWYWETARDFIFSDDYFIEWGDSQFNLDMVCEIIGVDIDWLRMKSKQRFLEEKRNEESGPSRWRKRRK